MAARITYLSIDRPELQFAAKELMRRMARPTAADETRLKRVGRFLATHPRLVLRFEWSELPEHLDVYVDSDFAGCCRTRKSTTGGVCMLGGACLKTWSRTQATLALSSGEAELAAAVKGATEGLGVVALLADFGCVVRCRLRSDATAAIGMVQREGLGRVRHLAVSDLWIQQRVRRGDISVSKWLGTENPSDMGTKAIEAASMKAHLNRPNFFFESGRSPAAPQLRSEAGRVAQTLVP